MKEHNGRSRAQKKNLCIALMVALLIGKASLLQGEAASPVQTGSESDSGIELSEEETESSVTEDMEIGSQEPQETGAVDGTGIESGTLETENPEAEAPKIDTSESDTSETESSSSENEMGDIQEGLGQKNSEAESAETEVPESDVLKSDILKSETSDSGEVNPDIQESKDTETDASQIALPEEEALGQEEGLTCLQIPEKLEIVIDPWEIDERGQIYSKPFTVKNSGNVPGVLTLSFACRATGEDGAYISETQEGLRASGEKLVYMKVVFEDGEEFIFTREGLQCQTELEPGEELALWFEGEVNEYAEEPWKSEDIEIEGIYSWKIEEIQPNETEDASTTELDGADDSEEVPIVEAEDIPPIEQNEEDGSEEAPPAGIEGEASKEEYISPAEPDEKSSSDEVPFVESTEEGIEESGPSESMSEE